MFRLSLKLSANRISPQVELVGGKEEQEREREMLQRSYHFSHIFSSGAV